MILNDAKLASLVENYSDMQPAYDCIVYGTIKDGVDGIDLDLMDEAVQIDGEVDDTAESLVSGAAKVAGGLSAVFSSLGTAADVLDAAKDEMANDAAIITISNAVISFYIFAKAGNKISCKMDIPLSKISQVRKRKILLWHTISLCFPEGEEINLSITSKVAGIKKQKENLEKFVQLLETNVAS